MNETPILFPISRFEFWIQIRAIIKEVVTDQLNQHKISQTNLLLPEKALLKAADVCQIFQISRPTHYQLLKREKI